MKYLLLVAMFFGFELRAEQAQLCIAHDGLQTCHLVEVDRSGEFLAIDLTAINAYMETMEYQDLVSTIQAMSMTTRAKKAPGIGDIIDGVGKIIAKIPSQAGGKLRVKVQTPEGLLVEVELEFYVGTGAGSGMKGVPVPGHDDEGRKVQRN